eukprot:TRINITY_DN5072_c0_g1_i2.p1 TRINITY_DN5072_c0_g1~~TRINITY_DN5072_c0_g1_i2.p1  ORF type:complete len:193 (-),score=41.10 TRINITY_DN5072_c0_g1_i2:24-602(-)
MSKSKSQEKKEKRLKALEEERQKNAPINAANQCEDLLAPFAPFKSYKRNNLDLEIEYFTMEKFSKTPELLNFAFDLTKKQMEPIYDQGFGWSDARKKKELKDDNARYIFVFDRQTRSPVGFVHIRFLHEDDIPKLYLYEIQIRPEYQNKGLGKFLVQICELIAQRNKMKCVELTVQKANREAVRFYTTKLKY